MSGPRTAISSAGQAPAPLRCETTVGGLFKQSWTLNYLLDDVIFSLFYLGLSPHVAPYDLDDPIEAAEQQSADESDSSSSSSMSMSSSTSSDSTQGPNLRPRRERVVNSMASSHSSGSSSASDAPHNHSNSSSASESLEDEDAGPRRWAIMPFGLPMDKFLVAYPVNAITDRMLAVLDCINAVHRQALL